MEESRIFSLANVEDLEEYFDALLMNIERKDGIARKT